MGQMVDWNSTMASYCGLPFFLVCWLGYKYIKGTKVVAVKDCDFTYKE